MTDGWNTVRDGLAHGGYVAWEASHEPPPTPGFRRLVPVFARLKQPGFGSMDLAAAIAATLALPHVLFSQHERDLLEAEVVALQSRAGWPHEVRLVAWCPRALLAAVPPFWDVLHVGPSVVMAAEMPSPDPASASARSLAVSKTGAPILAVIDDGIAVLNARFRRTVGRTRFAAVWLQAPERLEPDVAQGSDDVLCGRVLTRAAIDAMIAAGGSEAEMYRQLNRSLLARGERASTNQAVAHGTHVLDLAAGAAIAGGDPVGACPLLAVQVPPVAIRETSGRRLEGYVAQGLRWILAQALTGAGAGKVPPVVINLSLGSLAGPGDETAFLADWMRYEIARHARIRPGAEVRVVAAYGNARLSRLVARAELRRAAPLRLDWRLLPDDHTPSFLELRVDAGKTRGLRVNLIPPVASGLPPLLIDWPIVGEGQRLDSALGPVCAVVSQAEADNALLHIAVAPTAGTGPVALAPPGLWRVELATLAAEPVRVTARVQRDDTPPSYRTLGRQSWLDHPEGWSWDEESRSYTAPMLADEAAACPITREGTAVAFAAADHPCIYFVGSVRPDPGSADGPRASRYSASGAVHLRRPDESAGPTLAAFGDDGLVVAGRLAAGVLSGSVTRLSGTSMAAPQVARRLAAYFLATPPSARTAAAERRALLGDAAPGPLSPVKGQGVLVPVWQP